MNLKMNYNTNFNYGLKHVLANKDHNRFCNITWKNRTNKLEDCPQSSRWVHWVNLMQTGGSATNT